MGHPITTKNANIIVPFQPVCEELMKPFTPVVHGGYKYVNKITDQFFRQTAVNLLSRSSSFVKACVISTTIPFSSRIVPFLANGAVNNRQTKNLKFTDWALI